jgi:hypothetical protein
MLPHSFVGQSRPYCDVRQRNLSTLRGYGQPVDGNDILPTWTKPLRALAFAGVVKPCSCVGCCREFGATVRHPSRNRALCDGGHTKNSSKPRECQCLFIKATGEIEHHSSVWVGTRHTFPSWLHPAAYSRVQYQVRGSPTKRAIMEPSNSARGQISQGLRIVIVASLFSGLSLSLTTLAQNVSPSSNQPAPSPPPPSAQSLEDWRTAITRVPAPNIGCFHATYPNTTWQEVPCTTPPQRRYPPPHGPRPDIVGRLTPAPGESPRP